jgi:hypothetical protein
METIVEVRRHTPLSRTANKLYVEIGFHSTTFARRALIEIKSKMIHVPTTRRRTTLPPLHDGRTDRRFLCRVSATAGSDKVDTDEADEVIDAIAKTVAGMTSQQDGVVRQEGGSDRVEYGSNSTPPYAGQAGGSLGAPAIARSFVGASARRSVPSCLVLRV